MRLPSYTLGVVLAFLLQVGLLGWIVYDRAELLRNGREIHLAVIPIDPHDLFRGDYVTLNYNISTVRSDALAGDDTFAVGDTIYVALDADNVATAITHAAPASGMFLKGTVSGVQDRTACDSADTCWTYGVQYNLEKFFVPEGTGRDLEQLRSEQKISVDVAVAGDGRAALKRLLVDGEPRFEEAPY
ncbi:MAG TPA: GDYXXLXY domain-containing protein [Bauldia sp.]|nr:GDYXXLXY domain-containing protein [Bauldia sp.]